jgi:molybdopterin converting factor subunit 1
MKLEVQLFARARDLAGAPRVQVDVPDAARVADLRNELGARYPRLAPLVGSLFVAVDTKYVNDDAVLTPGCEVACFPPVSGG